nr:MAG TPA: Four and a half LIM, LIM domain, PROTEIN BINDING [Caudoviricetes sp.]
MATFFDIDGSKCFHCTLCRVDMPADELYRPQNSYCNDCFKRAQRRFDAKKYIKNKTISAILEVFLSLEENLQNLREKYIKKIFTNQKKHDEEKLQKLLKKIEQKQKKSQEAEERRRKLVEKYKTQKAEHDEKIEKNAQKIIEAFKNEFADRQQAKSENNMPRYIAIEERENARLEEYRKKTKRLAMAENYREKQAKKYYAQYANEIVHQERGFFNSLKCTQKR